MDPDRRIRWRTPQAAAFLGLAPSTLAKWRASNYGPSWHRCGKRVVFYWKDEVEAWFTANDAPRH